MTFEYGNDMTSEKKIFYVDVSDIKSEELKKYILDFRNKIKNNSAIPAIKYNLSEANQIRKMDPIQRLMKKIGYEV